MNNLWQQTKHANPLNVESQSLTTEIDVDVAVVGGGFSGLSTAYHLAEYGLKVAVLEAAEIGAGASGRNVGLTNAGLWIMPEKTEQLLGASQGQKLNQLLIDAPLYVEQLINRHNIDCDFTRNGTLHLAHSKAAVNYLLARQRQLTAYGAKIEFIDRDCAYQKTRAKGYYGALLDHRAGKLQPLKYCQGLAQIAQRCGAKIYTDSAVLDIVKNNNQLVLTTAAGKVKADKVVLATNAYETHLNYAKALYTPLHYSQLATEPLTKMQREHCLPEDNGCWDSGLVMRSFRLDSESRLLLGTVGNIHRQNASGFKYWAKHVLGKTFPELGTLKYQYAWSGKIAKSHNNIPQLLQIDNNILQIMGYSGRGIAGATVAGKEIAEYLTDQKSSADLALPFNQAKIISFNQLRATVYELGSQISHLSDHLIR
ncbi:MAG: FAD-binding oxidoreductase [Oceanospirillaceae bacterium]|nr:FAD-binding oxidoreductase [Oceanospirillaceae bacterium]